MSLKNDPDFEPTQRLPINLNSGLSIGLFIAIGSGVFWIRDGQKDAELARVRDAADHARDIASMKVELAMQNAAFAERSRDRITFSEVWHWAVQLQKVNNDAGFKLIVPEPQHMPSVP